MSTYDDAVRYELLTRKIYEEVLAREGMEGCNVEHNISIEGRSRVRHQIDVCWEFKVAGVLHKVLVECKNYASPVSLEKIRNFHSVLLDCPNSVGIMVTKTGFQAGVVDYAKYAGINLKLLRKPTNEDWDGRVRHVTLQGRMRSPIEITCHQYLQGISEEQHNRLTASLQSGLTFNGVNIANLTFLDREGNPNSEQMKFWVPRQLDVWNYADGGPYEKQVTLSDSYRKENFGNGFELVRVVGVVIRFSVQSILEPEISSDAAETVDSILKDAISGEWEHIYRRTAD